MTATNAPAQAAQIAARRISNEDFALILRNDHDYVVVEDTPCKIVRAGDKIKVKPITKDSLDYIRDVGRICEAEDMPGISPYRAQAILGELIGLSSRYRVIVPYALLLDDGRRLVTETEDDVYIVHRGYRSYGDGSALSEYLGSAPETERMHVLAALLTPLVGLTGHDFAPFFLFSGESGSGKSTAVKRIQAVWGSEIETTIGKEKVSDKLDCALLAHRGSLMLDNVSGDSLRNDALKAMITARTVDVRAFGMGSTRARVDTPRGWYGTSVGVHLDSELERRIIQITYPPRIPKLDGDGYIIREPIPGPEGLRADVLELVRRWIAAGSPMARIPNVPVGRSFPRWCEIVGGIVQFHFGTASGWLKLRPVADPDDRKWDEIIKYWPRGKGKDGEYRGWQKLRARAVIPLIEQAGIIDWMLPDTNAGHKEMGARLRIEAEYGRLRHFPSGQTNLYAPDLDRDRIEDAIESADYRDGIDAVCGCDDE